MQAYRWMVDSRVRICVHTSRSFPIDLREEGSLSRKDSLYNVPAINTFLDLQEEDNLSIMDKLVGPNMGGSTSCTYTHSPLPPPP